MKKFGFITIAGVLLVVLMACSVTPTYHEPLDLSSITLVDSSNQGIYPDTTILENEANPFRSMHLGEDIKWDLIGVEAEAYFYAWATVLARNPSGDAQYWSVIAMQQLADKYPDEAAFYSNKIIKGYQAMLEYFPDNTLYWDSVNYSYVGAIAYNELMALDTSGSLIPYNYVLKTNAQNQAIVIRVE